VYKKGSKFAHLPKMLEPCEQCNQHFPNPSKRRRHMSTFGGACKRYQQRINFSVGSSMADMVRQVQDLQKVQKENDGDQPIWNCTQLLEEQRHFLDYVTFKVSRIHVSASGTIDEAVIMGPTRGLRTVRAHLTLVDLPRLQEFVHHLKPTNAMLGEYIGADMGPNWYLVPFKGKIETKLAPPVLRDRSVEFNLVQELELRPRITPKGYTKFPPQLVFRGNVREKTPLAAYHKASGKLITVPLPKKLSVIKTLQ